MNSRFIRGQRGVSPVIAVILMVAITVILAGVLYIWTAGLVSTSKSTGNAFGDLKPTSYGYNIEIRDVSSRMAVRSIIYVLYTDGGGVAEDDYTYPPYSDEDGKAMGNIEWIYGRNILVQGVNFTFQDNDFDGKISNGDTIQIKSVTNGGAAEPGYRFVLRYKPTGDLFMEVVLG